ncbi:MAG: DUF72 domain-containing protein [Bacteroidales bacterium]
MPGEVRVGTSGWSYPAGRGTWNGIFYPAGSRRRSLKHFDELAYYAEHFDTVEVNSTFYRLPHLDTTKSWASRTPPGFDFSVKLFQAFTHPRMLAGDEAKASLTEPRDEASTIPAVSQAQADEFRAVMEPLASAGKLGALLVQFPPSFRQAPRSTDYLRWLLAAFADFSPAVELRHRSWSDDVSTTLTLLAEFKAAWVQIDEPKFRFSIRQNQVPNVTGFYYMRLHGRNAATWWKHDHSEDRYNYLYTPEELKPLTETVKAVRTIVRKSYLYLNNHFAAKSVADAVEVKHQLGQPITGEYREELLEAYPFLRQVPGCTPEHALLPPPSVAK